MEENTDGKRKTTPSLPANYISILQLQERWINDKQRKLKEEEDDEEERRLKPQVEEQQTIEKKEDLNSKKTDSIDDGEARCSEKEVTKVAFGSERGEDAAPRDNRAPEMKTRFRKRYDSRKKKKKKNHDVLATMKEDTVECGSIVPLENQKTVVCCEKAVTDDVTAMKTQSENLSIERGEKSKTRSSNLNRLNRRPDLNPHRVAVVDEEDAVVECGSIRTENRTPVVKEAIRVYRKKTVTDDATAIETQSKNLSIERGETKTLKAKTRSRNRRRRDMNPQRVAVEEDDVVMCESIRTERYTPVVKDVIRVYRKKGEREAIVRSLEKAVVIDDVDGKAIETQFDDLSITRGKEKGGIKNAKAQTRSSDCSRIKQRCDLPPRHGRMAIGEATMVWVKKGQKEIDGDDGIRSSVKTLYA